MTPQKLLNHLNPCPLLRRGWVLILLVVGSLAFSPQTRAACDTPDPGCPIGNLAEGYLALASLSGGVYNTGIGAFSLLSLTDGSVNTAVGAGALFSSSASNCTAVGAGALFSNTDGNNNTATGAFALFSNSSGAANTAIGRDALLVNTTGTFNTALGHGTLVSNVDSDDNTAVGFFALHDNVAIQNTAVGVQALDVNTIGPNNVAVGWHALFNNIIGGANTAVGSAALVNSEGPFNIGVGFQAGTAITTASNVIAIGSPGANTSNTCFIGNIRGVTTDVADAIPVLIDSAGQLGTASSSQRYKKDIKPMESASNSILDLKPVTFHYKKDRSNTPQFGLIAEEVAKVNPDLVVRDKDGEIYTVRYDAVNAMLLNEFLKEHKKVEEQQANIAELKSTVAQQQKGMEVLTAQLKEQAAQIQKVSAQLEMSKPAPQVVANKP